MRDRGEKRKAHTFRDSCRVIFSRTHDDQTDCAWHAPEERRGAEHSLQLSGPRAGDETKAIEGRQDRGIERIGAATEIQDHGAACCAGVDQTNEPLTVERRVQRRRTRQEQDRRPARDQIALASRLQERVRDIRGGEAGSERERGDPPVQIHEKRCLATRRGAMSEQRGDRARARARRQRPEPHTPSSA